MPRPKKDASAAWVAGFPGPYNYKWRRGHQQKHGDPTVIALEERTGALRFLFVCVPPYKDDDTFFE
jgi:hypothetical protein